MLTFNNLSVLFFEHYPQVFSSRDVRKRMNLLLNNTYHFAIVILWNNSHAVTMIIITKDWSVTNKFERFWQLVDFSRLEINLDKRISLSGLRGVEDDWIIIAFSCLVVSVKIIPRPNKEKNDEVVTRNRALLCKWKEVLMKIL